MKACILAFGFCFTCTGYIQQICLFESDVAFGKRLLQFRWPVWKKKFFLSLCLLGCERFSLNKGRLCCLSSCENVPRLLQHLKPHFYMDSPPACRKKSKWLIQNPEGIRTGPVFAKCHGIQVAMNGGVRMTSHCLMENSSTPRVMGYLSLLANLLKEWIVQELLYYHHAPPPKYSPNLWNVLMGGARGRESSLCFGMASLEHLDMPAYPPGTCPASLSNFQGQNPWDLHSKAMRPNKNSVTADGFHDAWRSKPGTWARAAGVCVPRAHGGGGAGRKVSTPPSRLPGQSKNRCRLQVGSKSRLDMM